MRLRINDTELNNTTIILIFVMLSVTISFIYCYAECHIQFDLLLC